MLVARLCATPPPRCDTSSPGPKFTGESKVRWSYPHMALLVWPASIYSLLMHSLVSKLSGSLSLVSKLSRSPSMVSKLSRSPFLVSKGYSTPHKT